MSLGTFRLVLTSIAGSRRAEPASTLGLDGCPHLPEHASEPTHLIDEIKNDGNTVVINSEVVLEVADQLRPRQIDVFELPTTAREMRPQPARIDHPLQRLRTHVRAHQELTRLHGRGSPDRAFDR